MGVERMGLRKVEVMEGLEGSGRVGGLESLRKQDGHGLCRLSEGYFFFLLRKSEICWRMDEIAVV